MRNALIVDYTKNMLKVSDKETSQSIPRNKEDKILNNTFDCHEEYSCKVHPRNGWRCYPSTSSSSPSQWQLNDNGSRIKVGSIGDLHRGLNSNKYEGRGKPAAPLQTRNDSDMIFSLVRMYRNKHLCLHVTHDIISSRVAQDV